jgi:TAG lipase/steryl ester hydrolase/phospholipase A2/LPA acyltransferase
MSLLSDTIFSGGSTRLHAPGQQHGRKNLRKSKSHAGLLAPLVQLARDPFGTLNNAVSHQRSVPGPDDALRDDEDRRQILYLRMKNVGLPDWTMAIITC